MAAETNATQLGAWCESPSSAGCIEGPLAGAPPMPVDASSVPPMFQEVPCCPHGPWRRTMKTSVVLLTSPLMMLEASDSYAMTRAMRWSCDTAAFRESPLGKVPSAARDRRKVVRSDVLAWAGAVEIRASVLSATVKAAT